MNFKEAAVKGRKSVAKLNAGAMLEDYERVWPAMRQYRSPWLWLKFSGGLVRVRRGRGA